MGMKARSTAPNGSDKRKQILDALTAGPKFKQEIADATGITGYLGELLHTLKAGGFIESPARGVYQLTSKPFPDATPASKARVPRLRVLRSPVEPEAAPKENKPKNKPKKRKQSSAERVVAAFRRRTADAVLSTLDISAEAGISKTSLSKVLAQLRSSKVLVCVTNGSRSGPGTWRLSARAYKAKRPKQLTARKRSARTPAQPSPAELPGVAGSPVIPWEVKIRLYAEWEGLSNDAFVDKLLDAYKNTPVAGRKRSQ